MEEQIPTSNKKLKAYFEKLYEKGVTETEVLEYKQKLVSFFSILIEIDQRNKRERRKNEQLLPNKKTDTKTV